MGKRILGRDVLNRFSVCFDGPGQVVVIEREDDGDSESK